MGGKQEAAEGGVARMDFEQDGTSDVLLEKGDILLLNPEGVVGGKGFGGGEMSR